MTLLDAFSSQDEKVIEDLLEFLSSRGDYLIFGGFAGYLLTKSACSRDVDLLLRHPKGISTYVAHFLKRDWLLMRGNPISQNGSSHVVTLDAAGLSLDICHYPALVDGLFNSATQVTFNGRRLNVISPEALLLMKLNHLTIDCLPMDRTQRDRDVIRLVRKDVDLKKLYWLVENLSNEFWLEGRL